MQKFNSLLIIGCIALLTACGGGGGGGGGGGSDTSDSSDDTAEQLPSGSHRAGENCMSSGCHAAGGAGDRFYASGTVYRSGSTPLVDASVRLYIHNTNTLVAEMPTDANGNFYSLDPVDGLFVGMGLVSGTDVEIRGPGGALTNMPGLVTEGSCNSCHGNTVGRITAR